jgi:hypothetical protein
MDKNQRASIRMIGTTVPSLTPQHYHVDPDGVGIFGVPRVLLNPLGERKNSKAPARLGNEPSV